MTERVTGGCLCGAVRFSAEPTAAKASACHCEMCRRWTSSVFMGVDCGKSLQLDGAPTLGVYVSSEHGERVFCPTCGSSLFWRMRDGTHTEVAAQAFDEPERFTLASEVFIEAKPSTYAFAGTTEKLTGAQLFAKMAQGGQDHA